MRKVTMIAALLLSVLMFFHIDISGNDEVAYADDVTMTRVIPEPIFVDAPPIVTIEQLEEEEERFRAFPG
ncbi:MAG: hypothetical protein NC413_04470 [Muribaculum sp.]|nr:hypothetical protein [Muribaculum sp.]